MEYRQNLSSVINKYTTLISSAGFHKLWQICSLFFFQLCWKTLRGKVMQPANEMNQPAVPVDDRSVNKLKQ